MPDTLLPIPHKQQQQSADCLAACSAMVLDYLDVRVRYGRLLKLLKIEPFGASAHNLRYLSQIGVTATIDRIDMTQLRHLIDIKAPVITLMNTEQLPFWTQSTDHVVVVAGYDADHIFIHDPAFERYPIAVSNIPFELSWLGFDYLAATLTNKIL